MVKKFSILWFTCLASTVHSEVQPHIEFEWLGLHVRDFALSSDGHELYLTLESIGKDVSQIIRSTKQPNGWSKPEIASFSGQFKDLEPFLHPNGLQLFFASNRDSKQQVSNEHFDIWMTQRASIDAAWGLPVRLNDHINTPDGNEFYPSVANNGNLYFTATKQDGMGKEDIYISRWVEGEYTVAEVLPATINSETFEFNAFINADESMLLFSSFGRKDGLGGGDLYVSYQSEGQWQQAVNLGPEINSKQLDYCPFYDPKNLTLYWTSNQSKLTQLPATEKDFDQWLKLMTTGSNGFSKIYRQSMVLKPDIEE